MDKQTKGIRTRGMEEFGEIIPKFLFIYSSTLEFEFCSISVVFQQEIIQGIHQLGIKVIFKGISSIKSTDQRKI